MSESPLDRLLAALRQSGREPRRQGAGWECTCPAHDDRRPSLSISEGEDGRALVFCHAGCSADEIVAALGLNLRDLMMNGDAHPLSSAKTSGRAVPKTADRSGRPDRVFPTAAAAVAALESQRGPRSGLWIYYSAAGEPVGAVVRWDGTDGKIYRPVSKSDDGWTLRGMPEPRPLYRLPHLDGEALVYVVEGEKCADAAAGIGLVATTSVHGAESPRKTDWSPLAGLEVIIVPDNDEAGDGYAMEVTGILLALSPPAEVRILRLPELPDAGDIVEFIAAREAAGVPSDAIRREVETLAAAAAVPATVPSVGSVGAVPEAQAELWPQPRPLPVELPPVEAFSPHLLPESLRCWVVDIAERMQCPIDYVAVAAMVALSAVIGRTVGIRPRRHDDWTAVPNLWGAVIGRPGVMKTPAIGEALKPLKAMEIAAKGQFDKSSKEREAAKRVSEIKKKTGDQDIRKAIKDDDEDGAMRLAMEAIDDDGAEPVRKRYIVNDSTVEKLGEILNQNPRGVLAFRDELVSLLKSLDKEGQESARGFFLEAWNGYGRYTYDRIGRGTLDIEAAIVSIMGGIQPGPLAQYLKGATRHGSGDDGLVQRFQVLVWPDVSKDWRDVDRPPDRQARDLAYEAFRGLDGLDACLVGADTDPFDPGGIPFLRFSDGALEVFVPWRARLEALLRSDELHPALESHLSKYRSLIPSLALILHLAEGRSGPVGRDAVARAIEWGRYLESHARRVYAHVLQPDQAGARALARRILAGEIRDGFDARSVYRKGWSLLSSAEEVKGAIDLLIDLDWLREERRTTDGRTATEYRINPRVFSGTPPEATDRTDTRGDDGASGGSVGADPGGGQEFEGPDEGGTGGGEVLP